ncbi:hypothetical protein K431DRAFT_343688 [Polychaeton citri CBS 116435]|uniref:F-box domain-containing protein n=1 Tax=Polychaeton citri CBS 116435 TaxID=1314669 RepID=A0A9P4US93_9PEZI|nr:hypothetical protein K431DRAFT_343688 [Polychaeton citri CBS 116435]
MPMSSMVEQSTLAVSDRIWSSVRVSKSDDGTTTVQRYDWDSNSLLQYRRFRRLLAERKRAKDFPQTPLKGCFEDLPGEIRNKIYEKVMVQEPAYIELSPKTNRVYVANTKSRYHHMKRLKRDIGPALRLMRVNKKIGGEAASVYYGSNEFRFTSVKGWYVLDTFLREIGPGNVARLRHIAAHVPWQGEVNDCPKDTLPESNAQIDHIQELISTMGMHPRKFRKSFCLSACIGRTARILEAVGALQSFRLILPDTFSIFFPLKMGVPINVAMFPRGVEITLVSLQGSFKLPPGHADQINYDAHALRLLQHQREDGVVDFARERGLKIVCMAYDNMGYYPSTDPEDCIFEDWNSS